MLKKNGLVTVTISAKILLIFASLALLLGIVWFSKDYILRKEDKINNVLTLKLKQSLDNDKEMLLKFPEEYKSDIRTRLLGNIVYLGVAKNEYAKDDSTALNCQSDDAKLIDTFLAGSRQIINDTNAENVRKGFSFDDGQSLMKITIDAVMPYYLEITDKILVRNNCFDMAENAYKSTIMQLQGITYESYRQLAQNGLEEIREKRRNM